MAPLHKKIRLKDFDPAETYGYEKGHEEGRAR